MCFFCAFNCVVRCDHPESCFAFLETGCAKMEGGVLQHQVGTWKRKRKSRGEITYGLYADGQCCGMGVGVSVLEQVC